MANLPQDKNAGKTEKSVNLEITKENMSPSATKNVSFCCSYVILHLTIILM